MLVIIVRPVFLHLCFTR